MCKRHCSPLQYLNNSWIGEFNIIVYKIYFSQIRMPWVQVVVPKFNKKSGRGLGTNINF